MPTAPESVTFDFFCKRHKLANLSCGCEAKDALPAKEDLKEAYEQYIEELKRKNYRVGVREYSHFSFYVVAKLPRAYLYRAQTLGYLEEQNVDRLYLHKELFTFGVDEDDVHCFTVFNFLEKQGFINLE